MTALNPLIYSNFPSFIQDKLDVTIMEFQQHFSIPKKINQEHTGQALLNMKKLMKQSEKES